MSINFVIFRRFISFQILGITACTTRGIKFKTGTYNETFVGMHQYCLCLFKFMLILTLFSDVQVEKNLFINDQHKYMDADYDSHTNTLKKK